MKKGLAILLPVVMMLAACDNSYTAPTSSAPVSEEEEESSTVVSSDSSEVEVESDPVSEESSSSEEFTIPTVTPKLTITVTGITVSDENGIYVSSPSLEGGNADNWVQAAATENTDGTWSISFPEIEVDSLITYDVYVQNKEADLWSGLKCNECSGNDNHLTFMTEEGKTDYAVSVTFSEQPDSSKVVENVTFKITVNDKDGKPIYDEGLYLWSGDSVHGYGEGMLIWTGDATGVYTHTFDSLPAGHFGINFYLENTDVQSAIKWNVSDTLGQAGYGFTIVEGTTEYALTIVFSSVPTPADPEAPTYEMNLTVNVTGTTDISGWNEIQVWTGTGNTINNWSGRVYKGETAGTYTGTISFSAEGTYIFQLFYWVADGDERNSYADANKTYYSVTIGTTAVNATIETSMDNNVNAGTLTNA